MIRNYLKTAIRIINRNKAFSVINILGFSVGLISCLVIFLFVRHELSFDRHISDHGRIYRIVPEKEGSRELVEDPTVPFPLGRALEEKTTGHELTSSIFYAQEATVVLEEQKFKGEGLVFADERFLEMFDVEMVYGHPASLSDPGNAFLSQSLARKYFGDDKAVGKTINLEDILHVKVAGVFRDRPDNTHLPFKMLVSQPSLNNEMVGFEYDNWSLRISGFSSYVKLQEGTLVEDYEDQIMELIRENSELDESNLTPYYLQALDDIHLDPTYNSFQGAYTTSSKFLWIFISVGLFILIIASINFINLSTVQALRRTREVGVRKILGADRFKIIRQFLGETVLLLLAAEIVALIVAEIILPHAGSILGNNIKISLYQDHTVIIFMIVVLGVFGFIAGAYPALFLSRYKPLQAIRSMTGGAGKKNLTIFGSLVVLQFFISQVLIIASIVASHQINFFKTRDLGFETNNIVMINQYSRGERDHETFEQALRQIPEVEDVTLGIGAPLALSNIKSGMVLPGREEERYPANVKTVDENYLRFYDLSLLAGRMFTPQAEGDSLRDALINEQLLYDMGFDDPDDILGKNLLGFGGSNRIVGVVKNFHTQSLHGDMGGTLLTYMPRYFITASVKLQEGYNDGTIKKIRQTWDEFYPGQIFDYEFLEEEIMNQYQSEERTSAIVQTFTIVAIIIAILGLYGLVSFMLIQRTKEIGIRKTQGATVGGIIRLLSGSYLKYILIAGLLAWPAAWFLLQRWLQDFAYHVDLHPGYFVLATGLLLLISFATIIYQTLKTANTNPADTLRDE